MKRKMTLSAFWIILLCFTGNALYADISGGIGGIAEIFALLSVFPFMLIVWIIAGIIAGIIVYNKWSKKQETRQSKKIFFIKFISLSLFIIPILAGISSFILVCNQLSISVIVIIVYLALSYFTIGIISKLKFFNKLKTDEQKGIAVSISGLLLSSQILIVTLIFLNINYHIIDLDINISFFSILSLSISTYIIILFISMAIGILQYQRLKDSKKRNISVSKTIYLTLAAFYILIILLIQYSLYELIIPVTFALFAGTIAFLIMHFIFLFIYKKDRLPLIIKTAKSILSLVVGIFIFYSLYNTKELTITLATACHNGRLQDVKFLLFLGVSPNGSDLYDRFAIDNAAAAGNLEITKLLLEKKADVNIKDKIGWTALMSAVNYNFPEVAKLLIEKGADVNAKTDNRTTALLLAKNNIELIKLLVENGADINAQDENGQTLLMLACDKEFSNMTKTIKYLIENGADVNAKNNDSKTALMIASENGFSNIFKLLKEKGAK